MKNTALLLAAVIPLAGCNPPAQPTTIDQCLRVQLFQACEAALPRGPESLAGYNSSVNKSIDACDDAARGQAVRLREKVKPECRSDDP